MKNCIRTCVFVSTLFAQVAFAGDFGLGVVLGNPTGLSAKKYLSNGNSVDAALAWSLANDSSIHFHSDYLWSKKSALVLDGSALDVFYGVGGRLVSWSNRYRSRFHDNYHAFDLGIRAPVGLNYNFKNPDVEVFGELAVVLDLLPATDAELDVGIGARFYF